MVTRKRGFLVMGDQEFENCAAGAALGAAEKLRSGKRAGGIQGSACPEKSEGPPATPGGPSWGRALVCERGGPVKEG